MFLVRVLLFLSLSVLPQLLYGAEQENSRVLANGSFLGGFRILATSDTGYDCSQATQPSDLAKRVIGKAKNCCDGFSNFKYLKKLKLGSSGKTLKFGNGTKAYNFETGKSFFWAFELPKYERPYELYLRGRPGDMFEPLFYPIAMLLDENYNIISETRNDLLHDDRYKIIGKTVINNPQAAYLIIKTTDEAMKGCSVLTNLQFTRYENFSHKSLSAHSPMGKIKVELRELNLEQ